MPAPAPPAPIPVVRGRSSRDTERTSSPPPFPIHSRAAKPAEVTRPVPVPRAQSRAESRTNDGRSIRSTLVNPTPAQPFSYSDIPTMSNTGRVNIPHPHQIERPESAHQRVEDEYSPSYPFPRQAEDVEPSARDRYKSIYSSRPSTSMSMIDILAPSSNGLRTYRSDDSSSQAMVQEWLGYRSGPSMPVEVR